MNSHIHLAGRRKLARRAACAKVRTPTHPGRAAQLRAMAEQATTEKMRKRLHEMARRCGVGHEEVDGLSRLLLDVYII
jgi:hypothetical protein